MICKVCKKLFIPKKENRYAIVKAPVGLSALTEQTKIYEAFDCPRCGCQNIVNVREGIPDELISTSDRSIREN